MAFSHLFGFLGQHKLLERNAKFKKKLVFSFLFLVMLYRRSPAFAMSTTFFCFCFPGGWCFHHGLRGWHAHMKSYQPDIWHHACLIWFLFMCTMICFFQCSMWNPGPKSNPTKMLPKSLLTLLLASTSIVAVAALTPEGGKCLVDRRLQSLRCREENLPGIKVRSVQHQRLFGICKTTFYLSCFIGFVSELSGYCAQ